MEKKCQVDDRVSFSNGISLGHTSLTDKNKTSLQNQRESDVSAISSERVQSTQQTSSRSDLSSEAGQPIDKEGKDPDASRTEVSQGEASKESGDLVQLNSVDSIDPKPCQSSNEDTAEKKSCTRQDVSRYSHPSDGSSCVLREQDSSHMSIKVDPTADSTSSKHHCEFDLNEDTDDNGAVCPQQPFHEIKSSVDSVGASEPIPVVAKVGVPIGLPRKPLQFGGELGWRRSTTTSAFRPTFSKRSDSENATGESRQSLASQGIDLNIAATMDSEHCIDDNSMDISAKQNGRFPLDLNCRSEHDENRYKRGASGFDLNFNPAIEDACKHIIQVGENRHMSKNYIPAGSTIDSRASGSQSISDPRRPSYWVDLSSVPGFNHPLSRPFLVAASTAEQVRMVVPTQSDIPFLPHAPSGLHIDRDHSVPPAFYPHAMLSHFNNQQPTAAVIPHLSGSVIAAYPGGALHVIDTQVLYPAVYTANVRPTVAQNGSIALVENGSRGVGNLGFVVPTTTRNAFFEERMKPPERLALPPSSIKRREPDGGWDYSQVDYRSMASWN